MQSSHLAQIAGPEPVVVDFWATWCGPCKLISPHFNKLEEKFPGVKFVKVDIEEQPVSGLVGGRWLCRDTVVLGTAWHDTAKWWHVAGSGKGLGRSIKAAPTLRDCARKKTAVGRKEDDPRKAGTRTTHPDLPCRFCAQEEGRRAQICLSSPLRRRHGVTGGSCSARTCRRAMVKRPDPAPRPERG